MKKKIALILSMAAMSAVIAGCSASAATVNGEADYTEEFILSASYDREEDVLNYTVKNASTDIILGYSYMYTLYKLENGSETKISSYVSPYATEALLSPEIYEVKGEVNGSARSEYNCTFDDLELQSGDYKLCVDVRLYDCIIKEITADNKTVEMMPMPDNYENSKEITLESFFTVE